MTGRFAVVVDGSVMMRRRILPWSGFTKKSYSLTSTDLVEAKFFLALDLHHLRVLDHDLDRAKADATDRIRDTPQDLVTRIGLGLTVTPSSQG
jgi:hypothetical protein